jgi:spore coat protein H
MRIYLNQNVKRQIRNGFIGLVLLTGLAAAIYFFWWYQTPEEVFTPPEIDFSQLDAMGIKDNPALYKLEDRYKIWDLYVTVYQGSDEKTGGVFDLTSLNAIMGMTPDPQLDAQVYIVDPDTGNRIFNTVNTEVNSTFSLRGQSARIEEQKSYKIKVYDGQGTFQGQQVLNLNKHTSDPSRLAQKFSFDQMAAFPDMVSLRTTFFRVHIKDGSKKQVEYVNYGLFTHVEQPNKTFLNEHDLDPNGTLYKPTDFEFFESPYIVPVEDPEFDKDMFSLLLKIRENPDNAKLAAMLEDINNPSSNFPLVFQKYFDIDNYLTWCAMNLLLNNYDTMSRNYLLYSPSYSEKWYFLPWDYDKCMLSEERFMSRGMKEFFGLARYWGTTLHKRFYSDPAHVKMLDARIDELYALMMKQDWQSLTKNYSNTILSGFLNSLDETYDDTDVDEIRENITDFQNRITFCYNLYYSTQDNPMPIFLGSPKQDESKRITFNWSPAMDLQADRVYYQFSIFTDFKNRVNSSVFREETSLTKITPEIQLPNGIYYWSAVVYDNKGNHQLAYDRYLVTDAAGNSYYEFGMRAFQMTDGEMKIIK